MSTIYTCNKLSSEGSYNCLLPNWESVILRVVVMDIGRHGSRASLRAQSENSTQSGLVLVAVLAPEGSQDKELKQIRRDDTSGCVWH
jgi:hypothetical protein